MAYILITMQVRHFSILPNFFHNICSSIVNLLCISFQKCLALPCFLLKSLLALVFHSKSFVVPYEAFVFLFSVLCECVNTHVCGWRSFQELIPSFHSRVFYLLSHLFSSCSLYFLLSSLLHSMSDIFSN